MTPQEQHDLEKLLADVAGVAVYLEGSWYYHGYIYCNGQPEPSDIRWEPLTDANQMERVEMVLIEDGFSIDYHKGTHSEEHHYNLYTPENSKNLKGWRGKNKNKKIALALAIKAMKETQQLSSLDDALVAFKDFLYVEYKEPLSLPHFDRDHQYFVGDRGDDWHRNVIDMWEGFWAGWQAREQSLRNEQKK